MGCITYVAKCHQTAGWVALGRGCQQPDDLLVMCIRSRHPPRDVGRMTVSAVVVEHVDGADSADDEMTVGTSYNSRRKKKTIELSLKMVR